MFYNKKLIIIIAVVLVGALGIGAYLYFGQDKDKDNTLPVVNEPTTTTTPTTDYSNVKLPKSDNEGKDNLITEEENTMSEEELAAIIEYEKERENVVPEVSPEQIAEQNKKIEEAKKEAASNPEIQKPVGEPIVIEPTTPEPQKDANGFIYTKDEAVEAFASTYQKIIDNGGSSYRSALEEAQKREGFTKESFDKDLEQLMKNPYSSERLTLAFDKYRKNGDMDALIFKAFQWMSMGGDDGPWAKTVTQ